MDAGPFADAAAELIGLRIAPEWKPGVVRFLDLAAGMAACLEQVDLDDAELVLAPVYTPPGGADG